MKIRNRHIPFLIALFLLPEMFAAAQGTVATNPARFAVVELFTSEGCSSCPPADAVLSAIAEQYPAHVIPLSFHVDYWDRLGWKDRFSQAAFSQRQYRYAARARSRRVFTPEVIVNGRDHFIGSEQHNIVKAIKESLSETTPFSITLEARVADSGKKARVSYRCPGAKGQLINIVWLQKRSADVIRAGENKGRTLLHTNNVLDLVTTQDTGGTVYFLIPEGLSAKDCAVVVFTQEEQTMTITASTEVTTLND